MLLLSSLQLSAEGKPLTSGCSQTSQKELYYPTDQGAENTCVQCPECPEGQGLTPQCGSKVPNDTKIECVQCQAHVSSSNSSGVESCKPCQDCGLNWFGTALLSFPVTSFSNIHYNNIIVPVRDFLISKAQGSFIANNFHNNWFHFIYSLSYALWTRHTLKNLKNLCVRCLFPACAYYVTFLKKNDDSRKTYLSLLV